MLSAMEVARCGDNNGNDSSTISVDKLSAYQLPAGQDPVAVVVPAHA
ncbi:hypothetical protein [Kocuria salsicia]|uniref:Uncharacterized protein n=1 Tax=Kocuria salsicia TaxID=664639 RepID=A0ABV3KBF4_9MICC